ncbi:MAG: exodeoxyribonuclease VII small subunit [Planctomycetia bacterium]
MTPTPPEPEHPSQSDQSASFEESLTAVGDIVARLESGSLGLSESIAAYERGVSLLRRLHDELNTVEERVRLLVRIDDHGRPVLDPLPAAASDPPAAGRKPSSRSASKGRRPNTLPGMDGALEEA